MTEQSDIAVGVIPEMSEAFENWMIEQGAPPDKANTLMNYWHEFIRSEQGRKFRFQHQ